jgi:FkbM family methyltransferase
MSDVALTAIRPQETRGATLKSTAKKLGHVLHAAASRNRWVAELYLDSLGRVCRLAPDGAWKQFVVNSIHSVEWPAVRLSAVKTRYSGGELAVNLVPHLNEFDFQAQIYRHLRYEAEVFRWLGGRSYQTVVEIGANVGVFSLYFAKRFPDASVYAFEPSREAFSRLLTNVMANGVQNLFVFNCAISSESGFLSFHEPVGHLTNGSLDASFASLFSPQVITKPVPVLAASAMESFFAQPPVLVKIDVEGAEPQLLRSLEGLIDRYQPDLLIEVLSVTESALNELRFVRDGSYRLFNIRPEGLVNQDRFVATQYRDYALLPACQNYPELVMKPTLADVI